MNFKHEVKIGLKKYTPRYFKNLRDMDGNPLFGQIDYKNNQIEIDPDYTVTQKNITTMHECIHAIDEYNGIGLTENQVVGLSSNLLEFMKNNKKLVEYLLEDE